MEIILCRVNLYKMSFEHEVKDVNWDFVKCDYDGCKVYGHQRRCYFDIYELCPTYISHKNYLNTIRQMKEEKIRQNYKQKHL